MTNNLGHLPKIDDLDDVNIKRLETWYAKAYQDDNLFRTLASDELPLEMILNWGSMVYGGSSGLDKQMVELCRIRMANVNECFH